MRHIITDDDFHESYRSGRVTPPDAGGRAATGSIGLADTSQSLRTPDAARTDSEHAQPITTSGSASPAWSGEGDSARIRTLHAGNYPEVALSPGGAAPAGRGLCHAPKAPRLPAGDLSGGAA